MTGKLKQFSLTNASSVFDKETRLQCLNSELYSPCWKEWLVIGQIVEYVKVNAIPLYAIEGLWN